MGLLAFVEQNALMLMTDK